MQASAEEDASDQLNVNPVESGNVEATEQRNDDIVIKKADETSQEAGSITGAEAKDTDKDKEKALSSTNSGSTDAGCNKNPHSHDFEQGQPPTRDEVLVHPQKRASATATLNQNGNSSDESEDGENATASEISDWSDFSQEAWTPVQGPMAWVQDQMRQGQSPRKILEDLVPSGTLIPEGLDSLMLWKIIINIVSEPPKRKKLPTINTLDDVIRLFNTCKKIVVLTGAGVSVSCGIPDFRSRDGVYARLAKDFPNLPDPQAMFDIHFFRNDPRPFFKFAKEIYPGQFRPSLCHKFIRLLEEKGKLLRNYTQNIDTLEQEAGIKRVVQCHGSFATATCTVCGHKVDSDAIKEDIFKQVIPHCPKCPSSVESAVMKPDIVFFGESLPEHFHHQMSMDRDECDLLIVIGSSLKVRPVALIPNSLPPDIPQILINRERLHYLNFDVELLGDCDEIVADLCRRLGEGWEELAAQGAPLTEVLLSSLPTPPVSPAQMEKSQTPEPSSTQEAQSSSETASLSSKPSSPPRNQHHHHKGHGKSENSSDEKSLKRPFSSVLKSHEKGDGCSSSCSCSQETIDTIVSAGHKKDVLFLPKENNTTSPHKHNKSGSSEHSSHHHLHHHGSGKSENTEARRLSCKSSTEAVSKCSSQVESDSKGLTAESDSKSSRQEGRSEEGESDSKKMKLDTETQQSEAKDKKENAVDQRKEADTKQEVDESSQEGSIDVIRQMWRGKRRISLAQRLTDDQVLFLPPSRYVFKGAEVFSDSESEDSEDDDDDDDSSEEDEEQGDENSNTPPGKKSVSHTALSDNSVSPLPECVNEGSSETQKGESMECDMATESSTGEPTTQQADL